MNNPNQGNNHGQQYDVRIRYLKSTIRRKLIGLLDANNDNNWRVLRAVMEEDRSLTNCLGNPIMINESSGQTSQLLEMMQRAGKKVSHLIHYLDQMGHLQALALFDIEGTDEQRRFGAPPRDNVHHVTLPIQAVQNGAPPQDNLHHGAPPRQAPLHDPPIRQRVGSHSFVVSQVERRGERPVIVEQPQPNPCVRAGERVTLALRVRGAETFKWWYKESITVERGPPRVVHQGRVESSNQDYVIQLPLERVDYRHAGHYTCEVFNAFGPTRSLDVHLWVVRADNLELLNRALAIDEHPSSQTVFVGDQCQFVCHARSQRPDEDVKYQWLFRSTTGVIREVEGATSHDLRKKVTVQDFGVYFCEVRGAEGRIFSREASLWENTSPRVEWICSGKVALVICQHRYRSIQGLPAVRRDAIDVAAVLTEMGYHVISALGMAKADVDRMVDHFCEMICDDNVYGVVYVAGHGFSLNGRNYLKCYDCLSSQDDPDCALCLEDLTARLQKKNSAGMLAVFADSCRGMGQNPPVENHIRQRDRFTEGSGNMVVVYSTSVGMSSWEMSGVSVFSSNLVNCLRSRQPIQSVCLQVLKAAKETMADLVKDAREKEEELKAKYDTAPSETLKSELENIGKWRLMKQTPVFECSLHEQRSLMDELRSNTSVMNIIQQKCYAATNSAALQRPLVFDDADGHRIDVRFKTPISNVIEVEVSTNPDSDWTGYARLKTKGLFWDREVREDECYYQNTLIIEDLHRLKEDLVVEIRVREKDDVCADEDGFPVHELNLKRPLLAALFR